MADQRSYSGRGERLKIRTFGVIAAFSVSTCARPPHDVAEGEANRSRVLIPVSFRHHPPEGTTQVHIVGSFNGWDLESTPMIGPDDSGWFHETMFLLPRTHRYKFLEDGKRYICDPDAYATEPDGYGGRNGVLKLQAPRWPAVRRADGEIDVERICHPEGRPWVSAHLDGSVEVRLLTRSGDVSKAFVQWIDRSWIAMVHLGDEGVESVWAAELPASPRSSGYRFRIEDGETTLYFGAAGVREEIPESGSFARPAAANRRNLPPRWVRDAVFYQIFPERFANGDPTNDPRKTDPWGSRPGHYRYQGGDLAGITDHLTHIEELGATALYLNPIFTSPSNHKYDVADYNHIDPHLGELADFRGLMAQLERRGMRIVLDGVFNHSGDKHPAFRDLFERGSASPYAAWYMVDSFPIAPPERPNYAAWNGYGHLPELRTDHPDVLAHLHGAVRRWMAEGIDGWRLDAAERLEHRFWRTFRNVVREAPGGVEEDAFLLGEIWADPRAWLEGDELDGVTGYRFRRACVAFFGEQSISAGEFARSLRTLLRAHPMVVTEAMVNLLGSHDTARWNTVCGGDAERAKLGLLFLLTWPGAPLIYYGDEVAMKGDRDPDNRRAFDWTESTWDRDLLHAIRQGLRVRRESPALRNALVDFRVAETDGGLLYMDRREGKDRAGVLVNRGPARVTVRLSTTLPDGLWIDALQLSSARVDGGELIVDRVDRNAIYIFRSASPPPRLP